MKYQTEYLFCHILLFHHPLTQLLEQERIRDQYNDFIQLNERKSRQACIMFRDKLLNPYKQKIANGQYACAGGYKLYQADMIRVQHAYNAKDGLGVKVICLLFKLYRHL